MSIIIPNYIITNELEELADRAIKSFKRTCDEEIIVIDDGSKQGVEMLNKEICITNKKNLGYAISVNKGWKRAKGKYIITANNDVEVYDGWLEEFIETLELYKGDLIGGLGYRSKIVEGKHIDEYRTNPGTLHNTNYITDGGRFGGWMFPGGFFMMRKDVLKKVGYFDEKFLHGGYEDIDFFHRCKVAGLKLLMTPKVPYYHREGATRFGEAGDEKKNSGKIEKHNLAYFIKKWGFNPHTKEPFTEKRILV